MRILAGLVCFSALIAVQSCRSTGDHEASGTSGIFSGPKKPEDPDAYLIAIREITVQRIDSTNSDTLTFRLTGHVRYGTNSCFPKRFEVNFVRDGGNDGVNDYDIYTPKATKTGLLGCSSTVEQGYIGIPFDSILKVPKDRFEKTLLRERHLGSQRIYTVADVV